VSDTYKIAEVAERAGFTPSTLRYYEELGLVPPVTRTPAGYRLYDDSTLARLAFISRAKQLGCTLEEISDLLAAWEGDRCEPVQARLRDLVATKITEAHERVAETLAFTAQLQQAALTLSGHTPDGPCDEDCGCTSPAAHTPTSVALTANPSLVDPAITCTLGTADIPARAAAWQAALAAVVDRVRIENGVRLEFGTHTAIGELAELAAAEQDCCIFFRFDLTIDTRGIGLEVTAPPDASDLVDSLFGAAA